MGAVEPGPPSREGKTPFRSGGERIADRARGRIGHIRRLQLCQDGKSILVTREHPSWLRA